jgi:hypothetical protein
VTGHAGAVHSAQQNPELQIGEWPSIPWKPASADCEVSVASASVAAAARPPSVILRDVVVLRSWQLCLWDGRVGERFRRFFRRPKPWRCYKRAAAIVADAVSRLTCGKPRLSFARPSLGLGWSQEMGSRFEDEHPI